MSMAKRIVSSRGVNIAVATIFGLWLRFAWVTSRRDADGWEAVARLIDAHGAVIIVCWHQRIMLTPWMFDLQHAPCASLTSTGHAGRLVGWIHRHFGLKSVPMPKKISGAGEMRRVLGLLRGGTSIGISPDGPRGPARIAKVAPIQWARATQLPIVVFTFAGSRVWPWRTWDRLHFPLPFGRLSLIWRPWDRAPPARMTVEEATALAADLGRFMDAITAEADARVGRSPS
ncbi:lysophospholipid acyltransferase family protein [Roseicyclus sp.]|uniref:lysophospholipid acyltransferase family protein n=1 Tax=Roseicyclus sp. TaxID=1914329 RepID=UPI003F6AA5CA